METSTQVPAVVSHQSQLQENYRTNPEEIVEFARRCAKLLVDIVEARPRKLILDGKKYLFIEDWQMVGRFYNMTPSVEWVKTLKKDGEVYGYIAKAVVYQDGKVVSSAISSCSRDEPQWDYRKRKGVSSRVPNFQLRSMAQTRACGKALRLALAWVVVLAGYEPTPAEEMVDVEPAHPASSDTITDNQRRELFAAAKTEGGYTTSALKSMVRHYGFHSTAEITKAVYNKILEEARNPERAIFWEEYQEEQDQERGK